MCPVQDWALHTYYLIKDSWHVYEVGTLITLILLKRKLQEIKQFSKKSHSCKVTEPEFKPRHLDNLSFSSVIV